MYIIFYYPIHYIVKIIKRILEKNECNFKQFALLVDIPKGYFGNKSRRFFQEYEIPTAITGVEKYLIYLLKVILDACCGRKINIEEWTVRDAIWFLSHVPYNRSYPTMHKVLRHGAYVIKEAILPISQLYEEAVEARDKHIRPFRVK